MANKGLPVTLRFILVVIAVSALSWFSVILWSEQNDTAEPITEIRFHSDMSVAEFGEANNLERSLLKSLLELTSPADLQRPLADFLREPQQLLDFLHDAQVLQGEDERKNWLKIAIKFALWTIFLGLAYWLLRTRRITAGRRRYLYLFSITLFGVILGADPSPMGTVKDAIALYGAEGVLFPPRFIALGVFLLSVVLANKFICGWGCQFGALQDFVFRLNRNSKDRKGLLRQYKPPLWFCNSIRIAFFALFTTIAFVAAIDLIEPVDPFKIFKPMYLGLSGALFVVALLIASLFVYRSWCHFFCPFGLVGWLFEKVSINKISVDYERCKDGCVVCEKACPSDCMEAILKQQRTIPDCFACATCLEACPTQAISFRFGRRTKPPQGKFADVPNRKNSSS